MQRVGHPCGHDGHVVRRQRQALRDIVVNEIPRAFKDRQPYTVCAFASGWVVVAQQLGLHDSWSLLAGVVVAGRLRALATLTGLKLPRWSGAAD